MIILDIIAFIFGIGIIILVHEAGHFYFAKKAGILCYEFSIGMGPAIHQWKKGETTISLRMIPIGGYVSMATSDIISDEIKEGSTIGLNLIDGAVNEIILDESLPSDVTGTVISKELSGEHGESLEIILNVDGNTKVYPVLKDATYVFSSKQRMQITPYDRSFDSKKIYQRFLTLVAGVMMNFILAIIIYIIYFWCVGVPNYDSTVVGSVTSEYPAGSILQKGDEIISVNGVSVNTWTEFSSEMDKSASLGNDTITLSYKRENEVYENITMDTIVVINNIGLSNFIQDDDGHVLIKKNETKYSGVVVGKTAFKYDGKTNDSDPILSSNDIIKEIRVDAYSKDSKRYIESEFKEVTSWKEIIQSLSVDVAKVYFRFYAYDSDTLTYSDDLLETVTPITLYSDEVLNAQNVKKVQTLIGVSPTYHFSFGGGLSAAFKEFWSSFTLVFRTLKALVAPSSNVHTIGLDSLSGFVGIFSMVKTYLSAGFLPFLSLIAMLSVNIGVMNLLPIPALDGGRIVFLIYEAITKKKPNKKVEAFLTNIVYILLIILFFYVTYNDITRLFRG